MTEYTWTGKAGDDMFTNPKNWTPEGVPVLTEGDVAIVPESALIHTSDMKKKHYRGHANCSHPDNNTEPCCVRVGYCLSCKWDTTPKTDDNYLAMPLDDEVFTPMPDKEFNELKKRYIEIKEAEKRKTLRDMGEGGS